MRSFLSTMTTTALAAVLVILSAAGLAAQSSTGSLRGTVKDAQGVIPGATVVLINESNGTTRETVSNESGEYAFPVLDPAGYTVRVAVPGFRTYERKGVRVTTQANVALDIPLEVGSLEETITVTADAPLIETASASVGGVIDSKTLESIPTPGRSVFLMANLEPTVQASGNARWNRMQDQVGNSAISMGGGAVRSNNFLIDGFPVTDLQNRASTNPSMEAIQDMKVQVHTYDAEMGRTGGGVMNMSAKSGSNQWRGSAYTVIRPKALVDQLLIPKLRGEKWTPEEWTNGGGGVGGPIVQNKTFFWAAGEAYRNRQPQANSFLVPTEAMKNGDFSQVTRNGQPVVIRDPLTGQPFPGNRIPLSRMDPVGRALAGYMPTADTQVDNGSPNFGMTDLLPSKAYQFSTKVDHHFNNAIALNGFVMQQKSSEANANYNPVNRFVGGSYQLERTIRTMVLNNTYVMGPSTVLTLRGGYNNFDDNYVLPEAFDAGGLFNNAALTGQMSDLNRFPTMSFQNVYKGTGWTNRQDNRYYQWGFNGVMARLAGTHNLKFGGDFRRIGAKSLNYGPSTGTFTFTGTYSGNQIADLLLGYPQSGNVPLNQQLNGYVDYYAGFAQDDWRVNEKLTLNYGVRFERETGMREVNNQQVVDFATTTVSPLNSSVNLLDPLTGQRRQILGGLVYAGQNGAPIEQGNQPAVKIAPRVGGVFSFDEKTVLRGGVGVYYAPWNYPAAGTTGWGQIGYSATTEVQQTQGVPTITLSNPFPAGLVQPSGSSLGLLTGVGGDVYFVDPNKGAPRAYQYSADLQRELPWGMSLTLGYAGLTGRDLGWGGTANTEININQLDPKYQSLNIGETLAQVPNPFFGVQGAGQFASRATIERGQLLRPYPQFRNVYMMQSTGAKSQYHAGIIQVRKRATGIWGGNFSYTFSRLKDNQFGQGNFYSSAPGLQNNYTVIPGSAYYNPDQEYGRSLLDSPHKLVIAPTLNLPFGQGHKWLQSGLGDLVLGGWSVTTVVNVQSGFPIGVSQNETVASFLFGGTLRPNVVPGVDFLVPGDVTDRIRASVSDNRYLNSAAFTATPLNRYGNAPRTLPGVYSPWRNSVDLSVSKNVRTGGSTSASVRIEVLNMFNQVQWAAPASVAFGNSAFSQITNQATNMRMVQFTFRFTF
ncbi:MAG: carboxypeptidase regulatory-like domain-containing protein [Vicinamibacterales bacterium]